jgi:hypothetical protein
MSRLIIVEVLPPPIPNRTSLLKTSKEDASKSVKFSKVIIVNNLKTVYLMKSNHTPGTTRHIVNKKFQLKGRHGANAAAVAPNTAIDK